MSGATRRDFRTRAIGVMTIAIVVALAGTLALGRSPEIDRLVGAPVPRRIVPRLSVPMQFRSCLDTTRAFGPLPFACPPAVDDRARRRAISAATGSYAVRTSIDTISGAKLHARALTELIWGGDAGNGLDSSISLLGRLAESTPSGDVLTDLSAAYLMRWQRHRSARDLLAALEAAAGAVAFDSSAPASLFNMTIALQELHLNRQAATGWKRYVEVERDPAWRGEAEHWESRLPHRSNAAPPDPSSAPDSLKHWADKFPQLARELGMDDWLPEWAGAVLDGNAQHATLMVGAVRALSQGVGMAGDGTLRLTLADIDRTAGDRDAELRLAGLHAEYGRAQGDYSRAAYDSAARRYETILASAHVPPALRLWAMQGRATAAVNSGVAELYAHLLTDILDDPNAATMGAIRGRARWALGTTALRLGRYGEALDEYRRAHNEFARVREQANEAAALYLIGETQLRIGDMNGGFESMLLSLERLQANPPTVWMHNALYVLARAAYGEGFARSSQKIASEDVVAASELDSTAFLRDLYQLEALLGLARIIPADIDSVAAVLSAAPSHLSAISSPQIRTIMEHQLTVARARPHVRSNPELALQLLDPAIAHFRAGNAVRLLPALLLRADARVAMNDAAGTAADLEEASMLLNTERAAVTGEWHRAVLLASSRSILEQLVMLEAGAGHAARALQYLELGRRSFSPVREPTRMASPAQALFEGASVLTHVLIGDTLLTWVLNANGLWMNRQHTAPDEILALMTRARAALERQMRDTAGPLLKRLYDLLVAPAHPRLNRGAVLVIAADGPLSGIPFAALTNRESSRYLVEDHIVTTTTSVSDALAFLRSPAPVRQSERELLIANPMIQSNLQAGRLLPGALSETERIRAFHPSAISLDGMAATPDRVIESMRHVRVVHFAGHAVADPYRPERSMVLLAPNTNGRDRILAEELEQLDLTHLRLIILAACESMRPNANVNSYRGLADALLGAGVEGVVGSLWRVDDLHTSELMVRFHQALAGGLGAAEALAAAQRQMLASPDRARASPAAWAAFQYTAGRPES